MSHVAIFQKKILKQIDSVPKFEKFRIKNFKRNAEFRFQKILILESILHFLVLLENKVRFFETDTCVSLAEIRGFLHDWKVIQSQAAQPQR